MKTTTARTGLRLARPLLHRAVRRRIRGRRIDPDDRTRGRFHREDVDAVMNQLLDEADAMWDVADLSRLPTTGSQLNVVLAVTTMALYRALLAEDVPAPQARVLMADVAWDLYALGGRVLALVGGLRARRPHGRMAAVLRMLLRFPFQPSQRPGYEVEFEDTGEAFHTTWTWCPPFAFVQQLNQAQGDRGEIAAFQESWCTFDWPFNDVIAGGRSHYQREHTLSEGDDRCDMVWVAEPATTSET
jgi:hypothetical protein